MAEDLIGKNVTFLTNNWTAANTDNVTPTFANINTKKRVSGDNIMIYNISEIPEDNASGAGAKKKTLVVAFDCRSFTSYAQIILIKEEVERLYNGTQKDTFSDGVYDIEDINDIQDMSDQTRGLYRYKFLIKFERFNISN